MTRVAIDQGVDLKRLRALQKASTIILHQVHDLEQQFRGVQPQGRAATYGSSRYGGPDMYADQTLFDEILKIVGRENSLDAHHLYAAHLNGDEYFVTENVDHFISDGRREKLEGLLGIKVRRTDEFMTELLSSQASRSQA